MFSLIFLVCFQGQGCFSHTSPDIFTSKEECEQRGKLVMGHNYKRADEGEILDHLAIMYCHDWGVAS